MSMTAPVKTGEVKHLSPLYLTLRTLSIRVLENRTAILANMLALPAFEMQYTSVKLNSQGLRSFSAPPNKRDFGFEICVSREGQNKVVRPTLNGTK